MIYDSVISTGTTTISGCSSADLGTDVFKLCNLIPAGARNTFFYQRSLTTGQDNIKLSANGQTYMQEVAFTGQAINKISYQINTGDFFVKGREAPLVERPRLNFSSTSPAANSKFAYNIVTGGNLAATGDLGNSLKTSIVAGIGASATFNTCDYFLNGQKVYSGVGVGVSLGSDGTDFIPRFGTAANVGGVVTSANKNEFKYTAYRKRDRSVSITGVTPDVYSNTGFIEGRTNFYINGLEQLQESYLELYTGVTLIKNNVSAIVFSGVSDASKTESLSL